MTSHKTFPASANRPKTSKTSLISPLEKRIVRAWSFKHLNRLAEEEPIELTGVVTQVLPGNMFRVALPNGHEVLARVSGKMRKNFIRISVSDKVNVQMSPYDLGKARITLRQA